MFVDEVDIHVAAGHGGRGALAFRREKFVPRGGPSGGDGGPGGSVYLVANPNLNTLLNYRFQKIFEAGRGGHGEGSNRTGKNGADIDLEVPAGTSIYEKREDGEYALVADLTESGQRVLIAKGGLGGHGNASFATSTNRAPRKTQPGLPGEEKDLRLHLKLLADVGLVGFPNAGKSTMIARISAARPKIADYPFTTLAPNLGVVGLSGDRSFVVADVPGLIEGAHAGHGLGHRFLSHLERTKVLVHLVDVSSTGRDPVSDYDAIVRELELFPRGAERGEGVPASDEPGGVQGTPPIIKGAERGEGVPASDEPGGVQGTPPIIKGAERGEGVPASDEPGGVQGTPPIIKGRDSTGERLSEKPVIAVANKIDALDDPDRLARLREHVEKIGVPFHAVSAATGDGIDALLEAIWREVAAARDRAATEPSSRRAQDDSEPGAEPRTAYRVPRTVSE